MLRLTIRSRTEEEQNVALDGWIVGEEVGFLDDEVAALVQEGQRLVLGLEGVQYIDRKGREALWRWREKGVLLSGGSAFVRMLLQAR